jgi:hypothetical protein
MAINAVTFVLIWAQENLQDLQTDHYAVPVRSRPPEDRDDMQAQMC